MSIICKLKGHTFRHTSSDVSDIAICIFCDAIQPAVVWPRPKLVKPIREARVENAVGVTVSVSGTMLGMLEDDRISLENRIKQTIREIREREDLLANLQERRSQTTRIMSEILDRDVLYKC